MAKVFKAHIDMAVEELGVGYDVTVPGRFDKTPIRLEIVVTSKEEIPRPVTRTLPHTILVTFKFKLLDF